MTGTTRCSAIVVSYNSAPHLPRCLSALEAQQGVVAEIHVVDNASADGSPDLVKREFPRVHLVENSENAGFARANNQILEGETAEFIALVNPDTVLAPAALAACVQYLTSDPRAGVAATRLVYGDGTPQPSCHAFLDLRNLFGETLGVHRVDNCRGEEHVLGQCMADARRQARERNAGRAARR
jgi:GT2 family glycosyltransferase